MPDLEQRLRFLEGLSTHQTFTTSANTTANSQKPIINEKEREEFNEIKPQGCFADFLRDDSNFLAQRKLILHQEALQLQHRPGKGKHLQGIDGVEGKDVLLLQPEGENGVERPQYSNGSVLERPQHFNSQFGSVLEWPQYSNSQLRTLITRRQNALLAASNRSQAKRNHSSPLFWSTLLLKKTKKKVKRSKSDPSYVLHLAKLAVIDEQPRRALALLESGLVSTSLLRKQSLRSQVNLVFLHALHKGFEEVCLFLLESGFPSSPFNPIFAGNVHPRRFPSYFLVSVAMKRERVVHWCLNQSEVSAGLLNRAWFNGLRPLLVAQWGGSFGVTEALLGRSAGGDRSISYLTYLRCRSYFLTANRIIGNSTGSNAISASSSVGSSAGSSIVGGAGSDPSKGSACSPSSSLTSRIRFDLYNPATRTTVNSSLSNSSSKLQQPSSSSHPHRNRLKRLKLFSIDFACATGRFEVARLLLQSMPLEAVEQNDFCLLLLPEASLAMALLKRCPRLAARQRDWQGNTPLHLAARAGRLDLMAIYLQYGAPVDALNGNHCTALHEAASACNRAGVQFLISRGADCSIVDEAGLTALQVARRAGISSEELIDFFHAADTLKQTSAFLSRILKECSECSVESTQVVSKKSQKRFLFQKLFGKWRR